MTDALSERAKLERALLLAQEYKRRNIWKPFDNSPQLMAYESDADIVGYGGQAGGGKTDLICGLTLTKHKRALVIRKEKAQTEGIIQRLTEILSTTDGYNSQKSIWRIPGRALVEFGGLDNPGDEQKWQGRAHDLKCFDEVTEMREGQVRFVCGWTRTADETVRPKILMTFNPPTRAEGRWVISFFGPWIDKRHPLYPTAPGVKLYCAMLPDEANGYADRWVDRPDPFVVGDDGQLIYDFDPDQYGPEDIITPQTRTFIRAKVTDNPYYMSTGYIKTLQGLPEPLRSQMLHGSFEAGIEDDPWQVIPTEWIEQAMARWKPMDKKPPMDSMGIDVARGGKDATVIACRHGNWYDRPKKYPGTQTPDGPAVAGLAISARRDDAPMHIDVIGVGSSPYDFIKGTGMQVIGVNVSEKSVGTDKSGKLTFFNKRSELVWKFREELDPANNTGIALPPDQGLMADLTAFTWKLSGATIKVDSREDIVLRIGRSPDTASAYFLAMIETMKAKFSTKNHAQSRRNYNPLD